MTHEFYLDESDNSADGAELVKNLVSYNESKASAANWKPFFIGDKQDGVLVGGIKGHTHWDWLFISHLWVHEKMRKSGLGARLLQSAEGLGRKRNCDFAWLDTFAFQARPFYERHGYIVFGELNEYPHGHKRYFLRKTL